MSPPTEMGSPRPSTNSGELQNRYWPALYLIDPQGRLRAHHAGELHQGRPAWDELVNGIEALRVEG